MSSRGDLVRLWARLRTAECALRDAQRYTTGQRQLDLRAATLIVSMTIARLLREDAALADTLPAVALDDVKTD